MLTLAIKALTANNPLRIGIDTARPDDLNWLQQTLTPGFDATREPPDISITVSIDPAAYQILLNLGPEIEGHNVPCFSFDDHISQFPLWSQKPRIIHDPELELFYQLTAEDRSILIIAALWRPSIRVGLLRILRELATQHLTAHGYFQLHAAAISQGGHGVIICGPKRSGKTTLTIHALKDTGTHYISNDRAMLALDPADGKIKVSGMQTVIAIRESTIHMFGSLPFAKVRHWRARMTLQEAEALPRQNQKPVQSGKLDLNPHQFCKLLGNVPVASAPLQVLLFPKINPESSGIEMKRLDPEDITQRLMDNHMAPSASVFGEIVYSTPPNTPETPLLKQVAREYPAYECILGSTAYSEPFKIARLIEVNCKNTSNPTIPNPIKTP